MNNRYDVTFTNGLYLVIDRRTGRMVTGHRRLNEARHSMHRHIAAAAEGRVITPELDDLIRSDEEAAGPNN